MEQNFIIYLIVIALIIEVLNKVKILIDFRKRKYYLYEFLSKYDSYMSSEGRDSESLAWLIRNGDRMQEEIGSFGIVDFKPPFSNYYIKNYSLIINGLSNIAQYYRNGLGRSEEAHLIFETLLRYEGWIDNSYINIKKSFLNPIALISDGLKKIMSIPLWIMKWSGLLNGNKYDTVSKSFIYTIITAFMSFVTILSGIITIIVGWEQSIKIAMMLIKNFK